VATDITDRLKAAAARAGKDDDAPRKGRRAAGPGPDLRYRLMPSTVIGITIFVLAAAIGAAFSGTILYAYYEFRLDKTEERVSSFVDGFEDRFKTATETIAAERENAKAEIEEALEPLRQIRAEGETLNELTEKLSPSVWFVRSLDEAGAPSVGSAFVVASDSEDSLLLTSYNTVRAATREPGPAVFVRKGDTEIKATLWTWQEDRDLALLIIPRPSQPVIKFAPKDPPIAIGERLFAVSGLGARGAAISQGFVGDVSSVGIQHDAAVGAAFQGGPLVNSKGEAIGIASRAYSPLGFSSEGVFFGIPVKAACDRVLECPGGDPASPGARR
jgi:S1-C subfamily serine protease